MGDMQTKDLSSDPADYITGPVRGQANRGNGGTTRDGQVAVVVVEADSEGTSSE